ncbi:RNA-binding domain-containing protein [Thelephora ganbajun]|uniref:RNA-binding domain-containing protein n=1 Tax=Thelephora ganbajun TaxID=370292 RepID=A0ACB6Z6Q1_THEGA|nr:RNA-binding domain-containing protein [Thelephora ganbajun]
MFSKARHEDGKSQGYAHADFESKQDAIRANKDHQESAMRIGDRKIRMEYAFPQRDKGGSAPPRRAVKARHEPSPTIFIGNIPYEATREDISEALKPLGNAVAVRIALNREGKPKRYAHVDFTNTAEAESVLKHYRHHPIHVLNQEVRLDRSSPAEMAYPPSPRVYFTNWEGNASSLRSHFRALRSKIVDICFFKSPDPDTLTGSGFVEFRDLETATEALTRFNTPELALAYARSRDRSKPRSATRWEDKKTTGSSFGLKNRRERK